MAAPFKCCYFLVVAAIVAVVPTVTGAFAAAVAILVRAFVVAEADAPAASASCCPCLEAARVSAGGGCYGITRL